MALALLLGLVVALAPEWMLALVMVVVVVVVVVVVALVLLLVLMVVLEGGEAVGVATGM